MNPHKFSWGIAAETPVAMIIAAVTVAAWLYSSESKRFPWTGITISLVLFAIWTNITTFFALVPDLARPDNIQFDKVVFLAILTICMMGTAKRILALVWVQVGSIAFFAAKGGVFGIRTGMQHRIWGPPGGFYEDNNALAMATIVILPLLYYLGATAEKKLVRWAIWATIGLSLLSVIGSYSRGAFLGILTLGVVWWWRSKRRVLFGFIAICLLAVAALSVTDKWVGRMDTIETLKDGSAMGRIDTLIFGWNMANARPITGGGYGAYGDKESYRKFGTGKNTARSSHNIYLQALGTHGYVGFALFAALAIAGLRTNGWIRKHTKDKPGMKNENILAEMCWLSMVAFGACGMFQNALTWDLIYTVLAISVLNHLRVRKILEEEPQEDTPATDEVVSLPHRSFRVSADGHSPGSSQFRKKP